MRSILTLRHAELVCLVMLLLKVFASWLIGLNRPAESSLRNHDARCWTSYVVPLNLVCLSHMQQGTRDAVFVRTLTIPFFGFKRPIADQLTKTMLHGVLEHTPRCYESKNKCSDALIVNILNGKRRLALP
jgi:hypothetical protein